MSEPITNLKVKLSGTDGNAFAIIGKVRRALLDAKLPIMAKNFCDEAMSGDYDHLLRTCMKYVEVK